MLVWLSVWSEVHIVCIWSSWCHCIAKPHHLLPHLNPDPDWFYLSGTTGVPRLSWCSVVVVVCDNLLLQADYLLVLVSPLYCRVVSGRTRSDDDSDSVLHARHIHDRMYAEYSASQSPSRRFVPVVMSGASSSDVPDWLRKSSQPFTWPHQYKHLMFYLIQPAQVIANYVSRRNRAFPFGRS